jgi:hypothetical protein
MPSIALSLLFPILVVGQVASADTGPIATSVYKQWGKGVPGDPSYFPTAVWLQAPRNADRFRKAGINLYVGLWRGPTEEQLQALKAAGMPPRTRSG